MVRGFDETRAASGTTVQRANGLRQSWLRRLMALLSVACVLFAPLEAVAVPDVHDGDGQAQAATRAGAVTAHSVMAAHAAQLGDAPSCPSPDAPIPEHSSHVDHCAHGHTFAPIGVVAVRAPGEWPAGGVVGENDAPHESLDPAPHLRPPIA